MTPCLLGRPGSSPSCACPPHGMGFKKGLRTDQRVMFILPTGSCGETLHIQEFCKPLRKGGRLQCHTGLEMLNFTGLITTAAAGKGGTIRQWQGDSLLPHTTHCGRTPFPVAKEMTMMLFLAAWGQESGKSLQGRVEAGKRCLCEPASKAGSPKHFCPVAWWNWPSRAGSSTFFKEG